MQRFSELDHTLTLSHDVSISQSPLSHFIPLSHCLAQSIFSLYFSLSLRGESYHRSTPSLFCLWMWGCWDWHSMICKPSFHLDKANGSEIGDRTNHYIFTLQLGWETSQKSSLEVSSPPDGHHVIEPLLIYYVIALLLKRKKKRERGTFFDLSSTDISSIFLFRWFWFFFSLFLLSLLACLATTVFALVVFVV
jgi:hypothetical protein